MNEVEKFINKFKSRNPLVTEDLFCNGDCYYFAIILQERFKHAYHVIIKYLEIDNHFVTDINGRFYDIRGDITDIVNKKQKQLMNWDDMKDYDELLYHRIIRDCINF